MGGVGAVGIVGGVRAACPGTCPCAGSDGPGRVRGVGAVGNVGGVGAVGAVRLVLRDGRRCGVAARDGGVMPAVARVGVRGGGVAWWGLG